MSELGDLGVKLSKEDLQRVEDFWDNVITPACVEFQKDTGKPAETFLEAIITGIEGHVVKHNAWNAFERIWWDKQPQIADPSDTSELLFHCGSPTFDWHVQGSSTTNAMLSIKQSARA